MRVVGGEQLHPVDLGGEHFDFAGLGVEALYGAGVAAVEAADVGDDDPLLRVHVDAVGRAARVADAVQGPVRPRLGSGALLVREPDAAVAAHDHVFRALDPFADLLKLVERDGVERHGGLHFAGRHRRW